MLIVGLHGGPSEAVAGVGDSGWCGRRWLVAKVVAGQSDICVQINPKELGSEEDCSNQLGEIKPQNL